MMKELLGQVCFTAIAIGLVALVAYLAGVDHGRNINKECWASDDAMVCDTCYVYDTIVVDKPVYKELRYIDTVLVAVSDTIKIIGDTTVALPFEQKVYSDSTYRAVVSGFRPSLDSIAVYPRNSVVTIYYDNNSLVEGRNRRWGLGLQAGYGVSGDGLTPYIGVGLSYNIVRW